MACGTSTQLCLEKKVASYIRIIFAAFVLQYLDLSLASLHSLRFLNTLSSHEKIQRKFAASSLCEQRKNAEVQEIYPTCINSEHHHRESTTFLQITLSCNSQKTSIAHTLTYSLNEYGRHVLVIISSHWTSTVWWTVFYILHMRECSPKIIDMRNICNISSCPKIFLKQLHQ